MEPISIAVAAAALLASKFGEGFAKDAGASGWRAVARLREVTAQKFGHGSEKSAAVLALSTNPSSQAQITVAESIAAAARSDPDFAAEIHNLVEIAQEDPMIEAFVAKAYDNAKQLNIRGDNTGTINF
ncbi:hypothetical protein ABIA39_009060 [Nocardia sp. GAS34]|uniref:hypothetical protein n=1 Tax=unclassified Nocardia TaxID=2637762 RepID=UPI003D1BB433